MLQNTLGTHSFFSETIAIRKNSSQVKKNRGVKQVSEENQCSSKQNTLQKASRLIISADGNCIHHTRSVQTGVFAIGTCKNHLFLAPQFFHPEKSRGTELH